MVRVNCQNGDGGVVPSLVILTGKQKGGFIKGRLWRMCASSSFRSGGTCERTLVPVFVPGEHPNVPSFRFSFRGNILQNHLFGKPVSGIFFWNFSGISFLL